MKCTAHPHSSDLTARKCYAKTVARRADKRLRGIDLSRKFYKQIKHLPPVKLPGKVEVWLFYSAEETYSHVFA